jgi:hypothetical protein
VGRKWLAAHKLPHGVGHSCASNHAAVRLWLACEGHHKQDRVLVCVMTMLCCLCLVVLCCSMGLQTVKSVDPWQRKPLKLAFLRDAPDEETLHRWG